MLQSSIYACLSGFSCCVRKVGSSRRKPKVTNYLIGSTSAAKTVYRSAIVTHAVNTVSSNLATFLTNIDFSVCDTLLLGNVGWCRPASSHSFALGCLLISFFRGSLSLSSSLREALPPKFLARLWQRRGPSVFIAPDNAFWKLSSLLLTLTNAACLELGSVYFIMRDSTYPKLCGRCLGQRLASV